MNNYLNINNFVNSTSVGIWCFKPKKPIDISLPRNELIDKCLQAVCVECNATYAKMLDSNREDIIGLKLYEIQPNTQETRNYLSKFIDNGFSISCTESHEISRKGVEKYFLNDFKAVIKNNKLVEAWGTQTDISEQKRLEKELKTSKERFKAVVDTQKEMICRWDKDRKITFVNDAYCRYFHTKRNDILNKTLYDFLHNATKEELDEQLHTLTPKNPIRIHTHKTQLSDGNVRWTEWRNHAFFDENGELIECQDVGRDITEKHLVKNKIQYQANLLQNVSDAIISTDSDFHIKSWNKAAEKKYGWKRQDVFRKNLMQLLKPIYISSSEKQMLYNLSKGKNWEGEIIHHRKDGSKIIIYSTISAIKYEKNSIKDYVYVNRDITKRRNIEKKLYESEKEKTLILETITEFVFYHDTKFNILWVNKSAANYIGKKPEDLIGKKCYEIWYGRKKRCEMCPTAKSLKTGKIIESDLMTAKKKIWNVKVNPVRNDKGLIIGVVGVALDITKEKKTLEKLKESERKYRTVFENTGTATVIIEKNKIISLVNEKFKKLSGYSKHEIEGKLKWTNFVAPEYIERMNRLHDLRRKHPESALKSYEFKFIDRYGNKKDIFLEVDIIPGTSKSIASLLDITKLKQTERDITKREKQLITFATNVPGVVSIYDVDTNGHRKIIYQGPGFKNIIGKKYEKKIMENPDIFDEIIHPDDYNDFQNLATKVQKRGGIFDKDYRLIIDDKIIWIRSCYSCHKIKKDVYRWEGIIFDITKQKKLEKVKEALYNISNAVSATEDMQELYEKIREYMGAVIDTKNFYVALYNEDSDIVTLPYMVDEKDHFEKYPSGKTMGGYLIKGGKPLFATEKFINKLIKEGVVETYGTSCKIWMGSPLKIGEKIIGFIVVQSYKNPNLYTENDLELLSFASNEIARTIERKRSLEQIKKSLNEKTILLQEIHHRVKNNMQIISSLLSLQSDYLEDDSAKEMFYECMDRIQSMAFVHENLYQSNDFSNIEFANYLKQLITHLLQTYSAKTGKIELQLKANNIFIDISKAIPLGLIINELVTNSIKYAFPNNNVGKIIIKVTKEDNKYEMIVKDNGIGLPQDLNIRSTATFGLKLVTLLGEGQLGGKLSLKRQKGTTFTLKWKG